MTTLKLIVQAVSDTTAFIKRLKRNSNQRRL